MKTNDDFATANPEDLAKMNQMDFPPLVYQEEECIPRSLVPGPCQDPDLFEKVRQDWYREIKKKKKKSSYKHLNPISLFFDCYYLNDEWKGKIERYVKRKGFVGYFAKDFRVKDWFWYALRCEKGKYAGAYWERLNVDGETIISQIQHKEPENKKMMIVFSQQALQLIEGTTSPRQIHKQPE